MKKILIGLALALALLAAPAVQAVTCPTFAAGDTDYIAKLNQLSAGCVPSVSGGLLTTKGDLFGYSTTDTRVPVGTNGQVLTADSGETLGLKWANSSGALTATYCGYGSGSNLLTGTSDCTYDTGNGRFVLTKSLTGAMRQTFQNTSNGTSAESSLWLLNNNTEVLAVRKLSTGFSTAGLLTASVAAIQNNSAAFLFSNIDAADFIWSRSGSSATNEVARLGAGTLSLGKIGTTGGSITLSGSISGSASISASATGALRLDGLTSDGCVQTTGGNGTLSITSCGGGSSSLTSTYVGYGDGSNALTGEAAFTYNASTNTLTADHVSDAIGDVRLIPQNSQSTAYTTVLSDCGKHLYHPGADTTGRTFTIAANSSVAAPIGCALTFVNDTSAGVITIAITSDTMVLSGAGTTGSRTLTAPCMATALKITATRWMISGGSCLT